VRGSKGIQVRDGCRCGDCKCGEGAGDLGTEGSEAAGGRGGDVVGAEWVRSCDNRIVVDERLLKIRKEPYKISSGFGWDGVGRRVGRFSG
jgi:hypothetical protein